MCVGEAEILVGYMMMKLEKGQTLMDAEENKNKKTKYYVTNHVHVLNLQDSLNCGYPSYNHYYPLISR